MEYFPQTLGREAPYLFNMEQVSAIRHEYGSGVIRIVPMQNLVFFQTKVAHEGEDAAIASSANKDLRFVNNKDYPIYIDAYTTEDKRLVFDIYGVETRDPARTIEFESVIIQVKEPDAEKVYADADRPLGYIDIDSAQKGYKSQLWKIEKENGVEVNREQVNTSNYKVMPRTATVGVVTDDPVKYNEIMAAIGTQDIEHVKNVIALLTSQE